MSAGGNEPAILTGVAGADQSVHTVAGVELFHSIQDRLLIVTPQGVVIDINRATLHAAKKERDEIIGRGICEVIHGGRWLHIQCPLEEFLLACRGKSEETKLPGLGSEYRLSITPLVDPEGAVHSIMLQARDLTGEESSQLKSMRTAQLAARGELAAGVAHEVNNPINGIINFARLLLDDSESESLQAELLQRIVKEGERIATIIDSLLSFARESENEFSEIDLRQVIDECFSLVDHQLRELHPHHPL
jgi:signal transduction histidine kinase